jgi:hypothetical protein
MSRSDKVLEEPRAVSETSVGPSKSSPQLGVQRRERHKSSEPHTREPSYGDGYKSYSDEYIKKLAYPGEPIFSDNFHKEHEPKITHEMLGCILSGAIGKVKRGDIWRRLVACKDHRYIYYSKDLHSISQLNGDDIICFMEKAVTKEFNVMFMSYVVVRTSTLPRTQSAPLPSSPNLTDPSQTHFENKYLFWVVHFSDTKFQSLSDTQRTSFDIHKTAYLTGLFQRYQCFIYETHVSTIWKSYGLNEDEFEMKADDQIKSATAEIESNDTSPRTSSSDSSPRIMISPRSDSLSPRVIFLGKKKKQKKFGYLALSPREDKKDKKGVEEKKEEKHLRETVQKFALSPRTPTDLGTISLNLPPEIIDALHTGSLSMSISFSSEKTGADSEGSSPKITQKPDIPAKRARSYSVEPDNLSVNERRKVWANTKR